MFKHPDFTTQDGVPFHRDGLWSEVEFGLKALRTKTPWFLKSFALFGGLPLAALLLIGHASSSGSELTRSVSLGSAAGIGLFVVGAIVLPRLRTSRRLLVLIVVLIVASGAALPIAADTLQVLLLEACVGLTLLLALDFVVEQVVDEHLRETRATQELLLANRRREVEAHRSLAKLWWLTCHDLQSNVRTTLGDSDDIFESELDVEETVYAAEIVVYVYDDLRGQQPSEKGILDAIKQRYGDLSRHDGSHRIRSILDDSLLMREITDRIRSLLGGPGSGSMTWTE